MTNLGFWYAWLKDLCSSRSFLSNLGSMRNAWDCQESDYNHIFYGVTSDMIDLL